MWLDMNVLILIEKVNKNYRLRNERLYGSTILNNHASLEEEVLFGGMHQGQTISPP